MYFTSVIHVVYMYLILPHTINDVIYLYVGTHMYIAIQAVLVIYLSQIHKAIPCKGCLLLVNCYGRTFIKVDNYTFSYGYIAMPIMAVTVVSVIQ